LTRRLALASSGNVFTTAEQDEVRGLGGVGDLCLRLFTEAGAPVRSSLDDRVIGMTLEQLRLPTPRAVGVAGGPRKVAAIRGALTGGWTNASSPTGRPRRPCSTAP
jgi:DNA-binding transcriptional regulator LsrR (DeoR family)